MFLSRPSQNNAAEQGRFISYLASITMLRLNVRANEMYDLDFLDSKSNVTHLIEPIIDRLLHNERSSFHCSNEAEAVGC